MDISIKSFKELSTEELYTLLRLRSEVFVVEQECIYQDIDDQDQKAYHLLGSKDGKLVAYLRFFAPEIPSGHAVLGRILVNKDFRNQGLAQKILTRAITEIEHNWTDAKIKMSAQFHLVDYYGKFGFKIQGGQYLEDGIPHIVMVR